LSGGETAFEINTLIIHPVRQRLDTMRFYINILTTYFPDLDPPYDVYYEQILEQVQLAEELGWECFMFNEHHFLGYGGLAANPAVLLAAASARTSRIRLGPCIAILPLRHPLHTAEDYAMVDAISGGRLEFGIGSGNTEMDYRVFGVTRENDRQRVSEALEIILKSWSNERSSHRGRFWNYDELTLYPRPGAAAASAGLGSRNIGRGFGLGRAQRLSHHDCRPPPST
jgi:alkanesulfonate monooxygenase SsuD/methylene tetrahydromethanopterin reductase-like flavin-dependent oxidoreductase (luciferase family)